MTKVVGKIQKATFGRIELVQLVKLVNPAYKSREHIEKIQQK